MSKREIIKKGIDYLKYYGVKELARKTEERLIPEIHPYSDWYPSHLMSQGKKSQSPGELSSNPLVSIIVPTYETPRDQFLSMVESVKKQIYTNFQLCIADGSISGDVEECVSALLSDPRICYKRLDNNLGIAGNTNAAVSMAGGEYLAFLDHDDILEPDALYEMVLAATKDPEAGMIYSDEDKCSSDGRDYFCPHFKSGYNIDLLRSCNYICHFLMVKRELYDVVGGFDGSFDGAQDYDFVLKCTEHTDHVVHVPKILYHWRCSDNSTAGNATGKMYAFEAGRRALAAHLSRLGIDASVHHGQDLGYYRVQYDLMHEPRVSVIITTDGDNKSLVRCVKALRKSRYENYDFYIIKDNSRDINSCVKNDADGDFIIILNEELIVSEKDDWMRELLSQCDRDEIGIVGTKLTAPSGRLFNRHFPMKSVYHAGMILGMSGIVGNAFKGLPANLTGYMHRASLLADCSAVSPLMYIIRKETFIRYGGLDESIAPGLAGPDLCLRILQDGKRILYDPFVTATYYGKGAKINPDDMRLMRSRWAEMMSCGDKYYNPNFSLEPPGYVLRTD
ncbi:MAG: glycosyltransferase [Lachnospiraceae bacterium]|nr:glycosyltransferase [Lachnospiraceae bacterium]